MATPALWQLLDEATSVAERHTASGPERLDWRTMGHSAQVPQQIEMLAKLVRGEQGPKVCCEVGFNAGHSALVWLEGGCKKLVEFDLLRESCTPLRSLTPRLADQQACTMY